LPPVKNNRWSSLLNILLDIVDCRVGQAIAVCFNQLLR